MTLEDSNLLWLRGRAAGRKKRSLSDALDEILSEARQGGRGADAIRSVVGTVDIAAEDPTLKWADEALAVLFEQSLSRPVVVREAPDKYVATSAKKETARARRG